MMRTVIVDTGPIVALLHRRDRWHEWATAQMSLLSGPMFTCEAVLSEACFLLRGLPGGHEAVLQMARQGVLDLSFRAMPVIDDLRRLTRRYQDVPMSFADACLVRMAEERTGASVFTCDSDFRRYRRLGRQVIPLITPRHS
jgi:predicted nucleic acid-binding protein